MRHALIALSLAIGGTAQAAELITSQEQIPDYLNTEAGAALTVGGGVASSTDASFFADDTDRGGVWQIRGIWGTRSFIGLEGAYIGTSRDTTERQEEFRTVSNGGELTMRLALPMSLDEQDNAMVAPFAFGGAGGAWHEAVDDAGDELDEDSEGLLYVPVGVGVSAAYNRLYVDARFALREMIDRPSIDERQSFGQDTVMFSGNVGVEF